MPKFFWGAQLEEFFEITKIFLRGEGAQKDRIRY